MAQAKERLLHYVEIRVFCKAYEQSAEVLAGLDLLSPMPTEKILALKKEYDNERPKTTFYRAKDIELTVQDAESDDGKMTIYTLFFRKIHDTSVFMKKIADSFSPEEKSDIVDDPFLILDDEGKLFIRLDKRSLMTGKMQHVEHGDCYQIKCVVAAYPKTVEAIESAVKKIFS